jgi:hypothetical protein
MEELILAGLHPDPAKRLELATFTARLRGVHLQGLADKLLGLSLRSAANVKLHVALWTASEPALDFRPVACATPSLEPARDRQAVPEPAPVAVLRTGDLVRLEVRADTEGYLTLLNLGSSGQLKVVFPNPLARDTRIRSGQSHRLTVKLAPPAGMDRAVVIWTRQLSALTPAEWRSRIEAGEAVSPAPAVSTRDLDFVLHEASGESGEDWGAEVVALMHPSP